MPWKRHVPPRKPSTLPFLDARVDLFRQYRHTYREFWLYPAQSAGQRRRAQAAGLRPGGAFDFAKCCSELLRCVQARGYCSAKSATVPQPADVDRSQRRWCLAGKRQADVENLRRHQPCAGSYSFRQRSNAAKASNFFCDASPGVISAQRCDENRNCWCHSGQRSRRSSAGGSMAEFRPARSRKEANQGIISRLASVPSTRRTARRIEPLAAHVVDLLHASVHRALPVFHGLDQLGQKATQAITLNGEVAARIPDRQASMRASSRCSSSSML